MTVQTLNFASQQNHAAFNPGLLAKPDGSGYWIAYRKDFLDDVFLRVTGRVAMQQYWGIYRCIVFEELNPDFTRTGRKLQHPHSEDPRLFRAFNRTWCAYPTRPHSWRMWLVEVCLDHHFERVKEPFLPDFGSNRYVLGGHEKNWTWIDNPAAQTFDCIYTLHPYRVARFDRLGNLMTSSTLLNADLAWPYGALRGGTPSVLLPSGERLTIFHSAIALEGRHNRTYVAGALLHEPEWPYRPIKLLRKPLLAGNRQLTRWPWLEYEITRPRVVYPCGLVAEPNRLLVSYGVADCACAVASMTYDELKTYDTRA